MSGYRIRQNPQASFIRPPLVLLFTAIFLMAGPICAHAKGGQMPKDGSTGTLDSGQQELLLKIARRAIAEKLGITDTADISANDLKQPFLKLKRATFVTLTEKGRLRGCIGTLVARESILESVRSNAVNAAFYDFRFKPLKKEEFKSIKIEISILSEPTPLIFGDAKDLLAKLRPGTDGVIIKKGLKTATFLPQVWDQLPEPELFLGHLCQKAGLYPDEWKRSGCEVMTYQVQHFEER